ncbi:aromatic ring-hydroxylating dioxygenase subunit alpha [Zavarzinia sp.]|uniref:aromatic ring-hydroxylating oxygenase subunit alpha n=1 Tax=Zavarzinia sp. TaxID=2027920 RepID=UPI003566BA20
MNTIPLGHNSGSRSLDDLLDAVRAGGGRDLAHAETLPPAAYTSPEFYELECARIFRREWLPVGHIGQIPNVGDYFTIDLLGELLVVVRDKEGEVRVMSRTCLHRWAPVAEGKGNTKLFSCPFHRWGYGLDGQLVVAPFMDQVADFDLKRCSLPRIRSEVVEGTIYVCFSDETPSLAPRLGGFAERMKPYRLNELIVAYTLEFTCEFNWKIAVETFMESYHHIGAHAKTLQEEHPGGLSYGEDDHGAWSASHQPLRPDLPTETNLTSGLPGFTGLTDEEKRDSGLYLVYPLNMFGTHADRVHWTALVPVAANRTKWIRHVLVQPEAAELPNFAEIAEELKLAGMRIADEDLAVNGMQQYGASSRYAAVGRVSHLESAVWQLSDYVRRMVAA